jgi:hypothetical protein
MANLIKTYVIPENVFKWMLENHIVGIPKNVSGYPYVLIDALKGEVAKTASIIDWAKQQLKGFKEYKPESPMQEKWQVSMVNHWNDLVEYFELCLTLAKKQIGVID